MAHGRSLDPFCATPLQPRVTTAASTSVARPPGARQFPRGERLPWRTLNNSLLRFTLGTLLRSDALTTLVNFHLRSDGSAWNYNPRRGFLLSAPPRSFHQKKRKMRKKNQTRMLFQAIFFFSIAESKRR